MFRKSTRAHAPGDMQVPNRTRDGRGLGPFSSGHLTVIIVAIVLMIGLPVGAFAVVSGSNSFITDATSGVRAKVDTAGQLSVSPGSPSSAFTNDITANFSVTAVTGTLLVPGTTHAAVLDSVNVDLQTLNAPKLLFTIYVGAADCNTDLHVLGTTTWGGTGSYQLLFPAGIGIRAGHTLCAFVAFVGGFTDSATVDFSMNGYYIPTATCTPLGSTCY